MSQTELEKTTALLTSIVKVPEDKRDFLLGYMQCMVDMADKDVTQSPKR